jgi:hypothetical protein
MLQARTQVPLQPEQQVMLKVVEANPLRIHLQVQNPVPQNTSFDFKALLTSWGLEADEVNLTIAQALLAHAHTVNPDDVKAIRATWQSLLAFAPSLTTNEGNETAQLEALTFLHVSKLPINGETLVLARRWLNGLSPLIGRLAELQQSLDDVLWQLYRFEAGKPGRDELHDILLSVRTEIAHWPISPDQPLEKVMADLTSLIRQLSTPPEAKVAALPLLNSPSFLASEAAPSLKEGALAAHPAQSGKNVESDPLQSLTSAVAKALSQGNFDRVTTQALHRLADQLDLLANDLGASHLANLAHTLNPATEPYYSFPLLLATPAGPRQAQLKVYPQPGQHTIDPQNLRLAILLDLPALGEIAVDLTIFERHLNGKILSRQPQTHQLVEGELDQLHDGLSNLGYRVDGLISGLLTVSASKNQPSTFNGIDVSA